ncbi:unnamed protein product [Cylicostephanus goldi]|uniref:BPTI/Kunitz inhibitor domain-containing protein n=1 Tax=Cylicostephanus goldi TaxID=71465 RepID=A0A3P6RU32_CYLGO|nr:unnamed protein product [Cylicostephanus goldi]
MRTVESAAPPGSRDRVRQEAAPILQSSQSKQLELDSKQLLPPPLSAQLQEKCTQPVEPGPCKHFVDRWFFNTEDGTCHPFKYGGCAGNRNHFFTQNECEIHCARFLHYGRRRPSSPHFLSSIYVQSTLPYYRFCFKRFACCIYT